MHLGICFLAGLIYLLCTPVGAQIVVKDFIFPDVSGRYEGLCPGFGGGGLADCDDFDPLGFFDAGLQNPDFLDIAIEEAELLADGSLRTRIRADWLASVGHRQGFVDFSFKPDPRCNLDANRFRALIARYSWSGDQFWEFDANGVPSRIEAPPVQFSLVEAGPVPLPSYFEEVFVLGFQSSFASLGTNTTLGVRFGPLTPGTENVELSGFTVVDPAAMPGQPCYPDNNFNVRNKSSNGRRRAWSQPQRAIDTTTGDYLGRLVASQDILSNDDPEVITREVQRAAIYVYLQPNGRIRERALDETTREYLANLVALGQIAGVGSDVIAQREDDGAPPRTEAGVFEITGLPLLRSRPGGMLVPELFTVHVVEAETDAFALDDNQPPALVGFVQPFSERIISNLTAADLPAEIVLDPISVEAISVKRELAQRLGEFASAYAAIETDDNGDPSFTTVLEYLDGLDPDNLTSEQAEGIERGILAERGVLIAAQLGEQFLKLVIDNIAVALGDAVKDFLGSKSQQLTQTARLQEQLRERGANSLTTAQQKLLAEGAPLVQASNIAGQARKILGLFKPVLKGFLEKGAPDADPQNIDTATNLFFEAIVALVPRFLENQTVGGTFKGIAGTALTEFIQLANENLPIAREAFALLTASQLDAARVRMIQWNETDPDILARDRARSFRLYAAASEAATIGLSTSHIYRELAVFASNVQTVTGLVSDFDPTGYIRATEQAGKFGKYVLRAFSQSTNFAGLVVAYLVARDAAYVAFGEIPPIAAATSKRLTSGNVIDAPMDGPDPTALLAAIDSLQTHLGGDDLLEIFRFGYEDPMGYISARDAWFTELDALSLLLSARDPDLASASTIEDAFALQDVIAGLATFEANASTALQSLLVEALVGDLPMPGEEQFEIRRDKVRSLFTTFAAAIEQRSASIDAMLPGSFSGSQQPALQLILEDLSAVITPPVANPSVISTSPQTFKLTVRVRNVAPEPIFADQQASEIAGASLSLDLTASGQINSAGMGVTLDSPETIALPVLSASDGVFGSGDDETTVSWQFTYSGALGDDGVFLAIEASENGESPSTFLSQELYELLLVDPIVSDVDLDGIPTLYEQANGLDPAVDDATGDFDADGVSNGEEFLRRTRADLADTDGDNLEDGEELVAGTDGFVTDPLLADTDGDGTDDNVDGAPVDPGSTSSAGAPAEPIVAVSQTSVTLDGSTPLAIVDVSNAGDGTLGWTAQAVDPGLISLVPASGDIASNPGVLVISPRAGFDNARGVVTKIMVQDASGADNDMQVIEVRLGKVTEEQLFADGFEGN